MNSSNIEKTAENAESQSDWIKTPVANLLRYKPSGIFFARARIKGKLYRQSLKTDVMSVAKLKLAEFISEKLKTVPDGAVIGKMFVRDAIEVFKTRLAAKMIKESSKQYRLNCLDALTRTWTDLPEKQMTKVTRDDCIVWAQRFEKYSPSVYNNTCDTLRMILDVAVEKGVRSDNPAKCIDRKSVVQKELDLPSTEQFDAFVAAIESAGGWCSKQCADFVRFLAFGGFRKGEAANITWADCDFEREQIRVRAGDDGTGTKNGKSRTVPMISDMKELLLRMKSEVPHAQLTDGVALVHECEEAMTRAAGKVPGMKRITHHDLRHLFATRCIESGVDIPTVSRWLGHLDGGALAMRVYGHLRDHHSTQMARKVSFSTPAAGNVIALQQQNAAAS